MTQFKRVFSQFLRIHPKFRQPLRQHHVSTPTVANNEPDSLPQLADLGPESMAQNFQPSTDTVPQTVEEVEEYGDKVREAHVEMEVQNVQPSTDATPKKVEEVEEYDEDDEWDDDEDDEEDDDVPEVFPYDLARKTQIEMIIDRLYVAMADDDREIAALRTRHREKFTHIVRLAFDPLAPRHGNIMPSSWTSKEVYPDGDAHDDAPYELRLTCPALTRHYYGDLTALKDKQLLAARNYIARALPNRNAAWKEEKLVFPFSPAECEDARVLIVGPTDRSVDVLAVVVSYMAFLTASKADDLLGALQRLSFVHRHWKSDILGQDSLNVAGVASKKKW